MMEQYDSNLFTYRTKYGQIKYLRKGILEAINRNKEMERRPKDFNVRQFHGVMDNLLKEYEGENRWPR
ncbi:MAG: hypothetical protein LBT33_03525 [Spirochaetia bacterium]|nr:hypothetical protein [Spirochaetia bacterium]